MKISESKVIYNKKIGPGYHVLGFEAGWLEETEPGQFVMISTNRLEMPLRRPFTVYRLNEKKAEILYRVVGKGTMLFSQLEEGDMINVMGPLGKGFPVFEDKTVVLLSRGVGIASLGLLGERLKKTGCRVFTVASFSDRTRSLVDDYIKSFSDELITTFDEDGSSDVENIRFILDKIKPDVVYTCGSRRLIRLLQKLPYEAYVSLEERMGCGLGACLTCAVRTINGYKRACKDGPCFNVKEVIV
ncbi:MAG: hypothetical protein L5655_08870 [Thermosediminibacteraceae bacterium]|nr:hypothetical protein [Thermosediminibacteraceae bacterium]